MVRKTFVMAAATALLLAPQVHAASVSYILDQSNTTPPFSDGDSYLSVTIDDLGGIGPNGGDAIITFTVTPVLGAFAVGSNFGIQTFAFNIADGTVLSDSSTAPFEWILPDSNWSGEVAPPDNTIDGFGTFDVSVSDGGQSRQDPLVFSIDVSGDSISSYAIASSGNAGEGNAWFAAHVAGFTTGVNDADGNEITSAFFGGGDGVIPPAEVPEPISGALVGTALLGLVAIRRKMV
jgi:hypothetical protein